MFGFRFSVSCGAPVIPDEGFGAVFILRVMSQDRDERERTDRNRERSQEAHWRAAEAGAEEESPPSDSPRSADHEDDWENEGGALDGEPSVDEDPPRQD